MKKNTGISKIFLLTLIAILLLGGWYLFKKNVGTVSIPSKEALTETKTAGETSSTDPLIAKLSIPDGFKMSIFARNITGARQILSAPDGGILVSQTSEGKISLLRDTDGNGTADVVKTIAEGLNKPHGMEYLCEGGSCDFYVAEHNALTSFKLDPVSGSLSEKAKLADLPAHIDDRHFTRSLLFLPTGDDSLPHVLLISIGSSCNVCNEKDIRQGSIMAYDTLTKKLEPYASGLRNSVFMTLSPIDGKVWATEMGRDLLGDNIPPDEINIIEKGKNYGWPNCYGDNIHDTAFDKNTYIRNPCMAPFETPPAVDLQAHSAPLGLAFVPEEGWPEDMWYNLLVAYHGSWNRSEPTGYKIVRIKLDAKGNYLETEDFITGWLTKNGTKLGRPVDIKIFGNIAYISDDTSGYIYKLTYAK